MDNLAWLHSSFLFYLCRMVYRVIGTMSGSSMDGLDIVYCSIEETGGKWSYKIHQTECIEFDDVWKDKLKNCYSYSALELLRTHSAFGHWMGQMIHSFIERYQLEHKVHLIASHGHTVFHEPQNQMTFQLGDGASIAAITKLPVISDLRNMDIALGGQGAPIVPIGEKLFWNQYPYLLNIGGICNMTVSHSMQQIGFDVCPANRVLNLLANEAGKPFDLNGDEASAGRLDQDLLVELNRLDYYQKAIPKSLSNEFGEKVFYSILHLSSVPIQDKLHTMCVHIAQQVCNALKPFKQTRQTKMLVTGGGAFNSFLIQTIEKELATLSIELVVPEAELVNYKEALVMALIGVLRWREEINVLSSVTGAARSSVGGALWMGQE